MATPPPPSRLDANQVLKGAFDEETGRLRTDSIASVVNADIDVALDATEDNVEAWVVDENGNPFTDVNYFPIGQSTHDNLNLNSNLQVNNTDVSNANPVPVSDAGGSLTVDAVNLDIRDLVFTTDKVDVTGSTVALDAATLTALESITVQNPGGAGAVNIQDGGNSITIDNANLVSIDGKIANNYGAAAGAVRTASQIGNVTGAADFNSGATSAQTLRTAANIYNSNGLALSNANNLPIRVGQASQLDALGRVRTTNLIATFEDVFQYAGQRLWTSLVTAGGAATHNANTCTIDLSVSTGATDRIRYRSRIYQKQNPANARILYISANLIATATNVTKRLGQFDADNGAFFELAGSTLSVVIRSSTSGSPVDVAIPQSSWNIDKLDGLGPSGVTLDVTKQQVFVIDYPSLGGAAIRFGFMFGNEIYYVHTVSFSNTLSTMATQSLSLPIFFEVVNTAASAGSSMKVGLVSLQNESGPPFEANLLTVSNGTTTKAIPSATRTPLITIRTTNPKIPIKIENFSVFLTTTDELYISLTLNGTLTGATYANTVSFVQYDTAATLISGGADVYSFYLKGGGGAVSEKTVDELLRIVNSIIGSDLSGVADTLTISATSLSGSASAAAVLNLRELI